VVAVVEAVLVFLVQVELAVVELALLVQRLVMELPTGVAVAVPQILPHRAMVVLELLFLGTHQVTQLQSVLV
jgi:hypothetical protein